MRTALAAIVLVLVIAPAAAAKNAAPLVPVQQQSQMKQILASFGFDDLEYIPTAAPPHYIYSSNVVNTTSNLITLADGANYAYFTVEYFKAGLGSCSKTSQVKLTIDGVTIYSKGADVWRCLKSPAGKVVKVTGKGDGLSRADLGTMIASAKYA
jgi:hypothetical protein